LKWVRLFIWWTALAAPRTVMVEARRKPAGKLLAVEGIRRERMGLRRVWVVLVRAGVVR